MSNQSQNIWLQSDAPAAPENARNVEWQSEFAEDGITLKTTANMPIADESAPGLCPTLPGDELKFLNGKGVFSVPPQNGGGGGESLESIGIAIAASGNNQITLDSTPYAKSVRIFINGNILSPSGYAVSGTTINLTSALNSGDFVVVYWLPTATAIPQHLTMGGATLSPTLRGVTEVTKSANSFTLSLPAGSQAGDLAILMCGHGWSATNPNGWTVNDNSSGSNWNGAVFSKLLSSGDITAGSITIAFAGSFDGYALLAVFNGPTGGIREVDRFRSGNGAISDSSVSTSSSVASSDVLLYFSSTRANTIASVSRGTMQKQGSDGSAASGCLYLENLADGGVVITPTFTYVQAGTGLYEVIVVVKAG